MRKLLLALTLFCLLLPACGTQPAPTATLAPAATLTAVETRLTDTPAPTLTITHTLKPTRTPKPTLTRYPTWTPNYTTLTPKSPTPTPTVTPTFDARTIVTATPAPAMCPKESPALTVDLGLAKTAACFKALTVNDDYTKCIDREIQNKILNFLNQGGNINNVISQLRVDGRQKYMIYQDLTHDGVNDFVFRDADSPFNGYYFYTCQNGLYTSQSFWDGDPYAYLQKITSTKDLNADGVPEIVITIGNVLIVLEWDGSSFQETLRIDDYGMSSFEIKDVNKDGLQEIILSRGAPDNWSFVQEFPWRHYISVYAWNGSSYVRVSKTFDAPVYRFQAIQDADSYALNYIYDKAMTLYQDAIFNNKLDWWSADKRDYTIQYEWATQQIYIKGVLQPTEVIPPTPVVDSTEYPRLAAYAYYRMVILHTFLGEMDAAQVKYATLQEKFPAGSPGQPYAEMATAFWEAYQSTQKMYDGCAAAIGYAAAHPEILTPLGSDYHGWQSHTYVPADVCPFR